jgi:Tfp pilus assembly protein PilV
MREPDQSGFVLVDVIFATLVFAIGLLAAAELLTRSSRLARSSSEYRLASARVEEIADSLSWVSGSARGTRTFPAGRVQWRSSGSYLHLEAWGADSTSSPLLDLWMAK